MNTILAPSEFKSLSGIEYFEFEEDFIEHNMRCIPMIVRLKLDLSGIKLKLSEWCRFSTKERIALATLATDNDQQVRRYASLLITMIHRYTGKAATMLPIDNTPDWNNMQTIPQIFLDQLQAWQIQKITLKQWQMFSTLQRFALLKLCRPGHENENFPKAAAEFGLNKDAIIVYQTIQEP